MSVTILNVFQELKGAIGQIISEPSSCQKQLVQDQISVHGYGNIWVFDVLINFNLKGTMKAQINLHICAVWSIPLLYTF